MLISYYQDSADQSEPASSGYVPGTATQLIKIFFFLTENHLTGAVGPAVRFIPWLSVR